MILYEIKDCFIGEVLKRPSQYCKTPYVADVVLDSGELIMAHSPSLGCRGLADKDAKIVLSKKNSSKTKCSHTVELSIYKENDEYTVVGINPGVAETIAENALNKNCILGLKFNKSYTKQTTVLNSRFDFTGIDCLGNPFIMEVKNVPLADYIDVPKKERKKYEKQIKNRKYNEKIAYFPDGYQKASKDVVSPRALKHIQELEEIAKTSRTRAILCFVVQREDASSFQPSNIDPIYKKAVQKAWLNGVEIKVIQVKWNINGICEFIRNNLPINLFEECGPYREEDF